MNTAKMKLVVGGVLIAGGLGVIGYYAVVAGGQYAISVADYLAEPQRWNDKGLRLAGRIVEKSWMTNGAKHEFLVVMPGVVEKEGPAGTKIVEGFLKDASSGGVLKLERTMDPAGKTLLSEQQVGTETRLVKVVFEGTMPDTFKEGNDVIVSGRMQGDHFQATEVMTQCASKYEGVDGNYIESAKKAQQENRS